MNTYSTAERAAYKAGCLAVERRIHGVLEQMPEAILTRVALEDLWAILGAADQSEAIQEIKKLKAGYEKLSDMGAADRQNKIGKRVYKVTGYGYPGEIVADFKTRIGKQRFVVEATGAGYEGMLHVFSPEQVSIETPAMGEYTINTKIEECANLGIATTEALLKELHSRTKAGK